MTATETRVINLLKDYKDDIWNASDIPMSERMLMNHIKLRRDHVKNALKKLVASKKVELVSTPNMKFYRIT